MPYMLVTGFFCFSKDMNSSWPCYYRYLNYRFFNYRYNERGNLSVYAWTTGPNLSVYA